MNITLPPTPEPAGNEPDPKRKNPVVGLVLGMIGKLPIVGRIAVVTGEIIYVLFAIVSLCDGEVKVSFAFITAGVAFIFIAPICWLIGDAFRKFTQPLLYTADGIMDLAKKKLFWMFGPPLIAIAIGFGLSFIIGFLIFAPSKESKPVVVSIKNDQNEPVAAIKNDQNKPQVNAEIAAFNKQEQNIRKELNDVIDSDAKIKFVETYQPDFPKSPFADAEDNNRYDKLIDEMNEALNPSISQASHYENNSRIEGVLRRLKNECRKYSNYNPKMSSHKRIGEDAFKYMNLTYSKVIEYLEPIYEKRDKETKALIIIETQARSLKRSGSIDQLIAFIPICSNALENTSCLYKNKIYDYSRTRGYPEPVPVWQLPWMIRLQVNNMKKKQWEQSNIRR